MPDEDRPAATTPQVRARRTYLVLIGLSIGFALFQYLTSGEFVTEEIAPAVRHVWTVVHGFGAYPVMLTAAAATVVALRRLRSVRGVRGLTVIYLVATVVQWLLGHAISTLRIHALTPVHVVVAAIVIAIAAILVARSARWWRLDS